MTAYFRRLIVLTLTSIVLASCGGTPAAVSTPEPAVTSAPAAAQEVATTEAAPTEAAATAEAALATAEPTAEPTPEAATATEQSDDEIRAALQETVDIWSQAYEQNDPNMLRQAIDTRAPTLRRILADQMSAGGGRDWNPVVVDFEQRDHGYILAHLDVGGYIYTATFRQVKGKWLLSEPRRAELGKKKKIETEHVTFEYYPWDEDVAPQVASMLEDAYAFAAGKLGRSPDKKIKAQLNPTADLAKTIGIALAFYRTGSIRQERIVNVVINSPNSFPGGRYDRETGWQPQMAETLNHEFIHLFHDCCFANGVFQNPWMSEGLAVYLTEGGHTNRYMSRVIRAVQNDAIIPIWAPRPAPGRIPKHLEEWDELNEDERLTAYGLSATLVDYIVTNYGGIEGFWKLALDYEQSHDIKVSVPNAYGISFEEFEQGWMEDLKKRYGG